LPDEARLFAQFALALVTALAATPVAIAVATRMDFRDYPLGYKRHSTPTPLLGGTAVVTAFVLAQLIVGSEVGRLAPIVALSFGLWVLGTVDDRVTVSPVVRVLAEGAAATTLWTTGLGWSLFDSGLVNLIVTNLWVIGLVNAFNLMDHADGAAATVGSVTAAAVGALAAIEGDAGVAALSFGLAGACVGFLPYNLTAPARIFLGDGGSLPIGFALATAIMALPEEHASWPLLVAAFLLVGLPVLDTALVVVSRRRRRLPVSRGGHDHLTHRLVLQLRSPRAVTAGLGVVQAALALLAIGVIQLGEGSIIVAGCIWFVVGAVAVAYLEMNAGVPSPAGGPPAAARPRWSPPWDASEWRWRGRPSALEAVLLVLVALTCGLSPLFSGFYDLSTWGPITLACLAVLLGLVVARPAVPRRSALLAAAGLVLLWLWSLLSTRWAESADQALTEGNRWLLYATLFGILVILLREDRLGRLLLSALTATIVGVGLLVTGRMLAGDGASLFLEGRLHEPLGHISGQAAFFMLGVWPLVALAERGDRRLLGAAGVSGATLLLSLVLLSQNRAVIPAFVLSALVLLVAVPGRLRRALVLLLVLAGVAAAAVPLLDVYQSSANGDRPPDSGTIQQAAAVALLVSVLAGATWALGERLVAGLPDRLRPRVSALAGWGLAAAAVAVLAASVVVADPIGKARREGRNFVELRSDTPGGSRLSSGGGNRYDYWRIAAEQFRDHPIEGVGAGNYDRTYFLERRTDEDVTQPHSLPMQVLGESGLVGILALALFVVGVLAGFLRRLSSSRREAADRDIAVAAGGMFLVWLAFTSVDWLHLIPGLTGAALCGGAVLVGSWAHRETRRLAPRLRAALVTLVAAVVLFGAVVVGISTLAQHDRAQARESLASDPVAAIRHAKDSLALNDDSLPAYYVKAAAYARLDRYADARATLLEASKREPHDFVPWGLLGDLAVRRGDLAQARRDYRHAARLNPRDEELERLARNPRAQQ
jgi:UDP-GlcNAc:undecaprenyl-phosphate/decaprenyl-phosphate GlcNAc-1-phosphate transferase